jgi:hypothetical protein
VVRGRAARPRRPRRTADASPALGGAAGALLALQRAAGNRAARVVVQRAGPAPVPYDPGQPLDGGELGATVPAGRTMPSFRVAGGAVAATTEGSVQVDTRYVPAGLHDWGTGGGGPRRLLVPPAVADLARQGEQEHSDDIWWAHHLVAGEAARAVNALAAEGAAPATGAAEAHRHWRARLHDTISPKLRITADDSDPRAGGSVTAPWMAALAALHQTTLDRDAQHWHTMGTRAPTQAERAANPVPAGTRLVVAEAGGEIGQHPSEPLIRAAFDALPDRP